MKNSKFFLLLLVSVMMYISPIILFAQEDIAVEFSFKRPSEFICEIRNMTEYETTILISNEEAEGHSNLYFDVLRNDTIRNDYYGLNKDVNKSNILNLNSGECYKIS